MATFDRVEGLDGLVDDFRRNANVADEEILKVAKDHAGKVAQSWRSSVPVRTGRLRDSIGHYARTEDGDPVGAAYSDHFISVFREFGTVNQPPHGEANAALERQIDAFARDIGNIPNL